MADSDSLLTLFEAIGVDDLPDDLRHALRAVEENRPMAALVHLAALRSQLRVVERYTVRMAREQGKTWEQLAFNSGVTRQALRKRYRDLT